MNSGEWLAVKLWRKLFFREQWFIELEQAPSMTLAPDFSRTRALFPSADRFWADPFLLARDGRHYLFVEELPFATNKGRIAVIELFEDGTCGQARTVLERPYHLSYPFVFEWNGQTWMIPETGQNRTVELYRCVEFPDRWELHKVLLAGVRTADATLLEHGGRWWMYLTVAESGQSIHEHLHIYHAPTPLGPFEPHPSNPVKSSLVGARPAGRPFERDGLLYRPGQDCSRLYGEAVVLHRVDELSRAVYRETVVGRIEPGWRRGVRRVHTLNEAYGMRVVDALRWLPRWAR